MLRLDKFWGQLGPKGSKLAQLYHAILIGLKSSNNLRWLNILITIATNQFWSAPRLIGFKFKLKVWQSSAELVAIMGYYSSYMIESAKLLVKSQFTQGKEAFRKLLRQ